MHGDSEKAALPHHRLSCDQGRLAHGPDVPECLAHETIKRINAQKHVYKCILVYYVVAIYM